MFGHGPANALAIEVEDAVAEFLGSLCAALRPRYAIETGTYHGKSAGAISERLEIGHLDTIEIDEYSVDLARERLRSLPVTVHHCSSLDFIPKAPIEFAFLDSGIGDIRFRELEHFGSYMAEDATVAIHDSLGLWSEWVPAPGWRWINLRTPLGLLLLQKDT